MSVSVLVTARPSLSVSTGVLAGAVASPATAAERKHHYTAKKTGGESAGQSEAGAAKSCLAADPPTAKVEASHGGGDIDKLRGGAR